MCFRAAGFFLVEGIYCTSQFISCLNWFGKYYFLSDKTFVRIIYLITKFAQLQRSKLRFHSMCVLLSSLHLSPKRNVIDKQ